MKQLQKNYTTPEQSRRLLELGVPISSADIALLSTPNDPYDPYFIGGDALLIQALRKKRGLPSWSVGRLIEIFLLCSSEYDDLGQPPCILLGKCDLAEYITHTFETCHKSLNFSKLEEL